MNRYQKIAWFNLIVIAITIVLTTIAITVEFRIRGYSTVGWLFIGILVLLKFTPWLFKKPQNPSGVVSDERDNLIVTRAVTQAWTTFWWVFFAACFLLWFIIGPENSVPTIVFPLIAFAGGLIHKAACSVAILLQYGRGGTNE
jgi:hypothetical protein